MGYTKLIQYGRFIEIFNYSKDVHKKEVRTIARRTKSEYSSSHYRSRSSLQRSRTSFIRSVEAELSSKGIPTFITLTNFEEVDLSIGYVYLRNFVRNVRKRYSTISFYAVPEWQKTGRLHFHLLVWGLPVELEKEERSSRFVQRCWARGYADVLNANDSSSYLSLYLAKYMQKALSDRRLFNQRAYTSSYNVAKVFKAGSNSLSGYLSTFIPDDKELVSEYTYETQFLGGCNFTKYIVTYDNKREDNLIREQVV